MGSRFEDRTGEAKTMNNGKVAKIVVYRNTGDVDVEFDSGPVVRHRQYSDFKRGRIRCPMVYRTTGEVCECENPNNGNKFLVDADCIEKISWCMWQIDSSGYVRTGHGIKLHRYLTGVKSGEQVDHINGNRVDNRLANLRVCTAQQNSINRISHGSESGWRGVFRSGRTCKWQARICVRQKEIYLGTYINPIDAARAYNEAAIRYHGEFARLNTISEAA